MSKPEQLDLVEYINDILGAEMTRHEIKAKIQSAIKEAGLKNYGFVEGKSEIEVIVGEGRKSIAWPARPTHRSLNDVVRFIEKCAEAQRGQA